MKKLSLVGKIGLGLFAIAVIALAILLINIYRQPMGPALNVTIPTTISSPEAAGSTVRPPEVIATLAMAASQVPKEAVTPAITLAPSATVGQTADCGETGTWNVLVLGSDSSNLYGTAGSDLVRVMRLDFSNKKVVMFAFTRDLWVNTQGIGLTNPTINATGLGKVFYEALIRSTQAKERDKLIDATNASAKMLALNFGLLSDHYVTIDLTRIPRMIDTLGGIPIDVPVDTTDPWIGVVIKAGQQTLNGEQAMAYARAKPDSDFARIQRDNLLIEAIRKKALDPATWIKIPALFSQFQETVATDFSPEQIAHLACLLKEVPQSAIVQDGVRQEWTAPGTKDFLLWDKQKVFDRLKELGMID